MRSHLQLIVALVIVAASGCQPRAVIRSSVPLEEISTGAAVHAAVQQERVFAAERAIEAQSPERVLELLTAIAEEEKAHEASLAKQNAAARAEREACELRAAALETELQSGTRRWWQAISVLGGLLFVLGSVGAIFIAGVRREAIMLATAGILATGFALGVLAVLPWMRWIAIGLVAFAGVCAVLIVTRLVRIGSNLVDTGEAARRLLPPERRDELFTGQEPLADVLQDGPTRAFVRKVRAALPART